MTTALSRFGLVLVSGTFAAVALGPSLLDVDPMRANLSTAFEPLGGAYLLGADHLGRSMLARVVHGGAVTLTLAAAATLGATCLGALLGLLAAWRGGFVAAALDLVADAVLALPGLLLVLLVAAVIGGGTMAMTIALVAAGWVEPARVAAAVGRVAIYGPTVEAARLAGLGAGAVALRIVLPQVAPPLLAASTLALGGAVLTVAALGFLGVGLEPPTPEWGTMIIEGLPYLRDAPHVALVPGAALFLTVLGLFLIGGRPTGSRP